MQPATAGSAGLGGNACGAICPGAITIDSRRITDEFVFEVFSNTIRRFLDAARVCEDRTFELRVISWRNIALDRTLEVAVEVLAGIELW